MNLYEELKKTAKELEEIERDFSRYENDSFERGKRAGYNNSIAMIYSLLWDYEEANNMERS